MRLKTVEREPLPNRKRQSIHTLIEYKPNHDQLPLLILPDNNLLVYTQCPCYKTIYNYLISFSEPVNRPRFIHEYRITKFSLYTAMVLEYSADEIIGILKRLSKNLLFPRSLEEMIRRYMRYAGKVRLQLNGNRYELLTVREIGLMLGDMIEAVEDVDVAIRNGLHLTELKKEIKGAGNKLEVENDANT